MLRMDPILSFPIRECNLLNENLGIEVALGYIIWVKEKGTK